METMDTKLGNVSWTRDVDVFLMERENETDSFHLPLSELINT